MSEHFKIPEFVLDLYVDTLDGEVSLRELISQTISTKDKIESAHWIVSSDGSEPTIDAFNAVTKYYHLCLITTPMGKILTKTDKAHDF